MWHIIKLGSSGTSSQRDQPDGPDVFCSIETNSNVACRRYCQKVSSFHRQVSLRVLPRQGSEGVGSRVFLRDGMIPYGGCGVVIF